MNSIEELCTPFKAKYDNCFISWFRDVFLKGENSIDHDSSCGDVFKDYQTCLKVNCSLAS